tara:strand:+ start:104 stop:562 length:459 start_codon:yes stop_codon:yes gene_type:complete
MAKKPDITTIASGYYSRQALNSNFENLQAGFDNTLSLDGSTPNALGADLDMNSNDILNLNNLTTNSLTINGLLVVPTALSVALSFHPDNYTGDGSTVAFVLTYDPLTKNNTFVYVDGLYQNKNTYSVPGSTLTFSEAPPLNASIEVMTARTV